MLNSLIKYTSLFEMDLRIDNTFWVNCYYLFLNYSDNTHNEDFNHLESSAIRPFYPLHIGH